MTNANSDQDYCQPPGLHFSEDSIRLAHQAPRGLPGGRGADFGCGCGVVGLEALRQGRLLGLKELYFVEKAQVFQASLEENLRRHNSLGPRLIPLWADWRELTTENFNGNLDYIICNPPWFEPNQRPSPQPDKRAMRQELFGDLGNLLESAEALLKPGGYLTLAWPGLRQDKLVRALTRLPSLGLYRLSSLTRRNCRLLVAFVRKKFHDPL